MKKLFTLLLLAVIMSCYAQVHADDIRNPENEEFVVEVAFNLDIPVEAVTQAQFNQRYGTQYPEPLWVLKTFSTDVYTTYHKTGNVQSQPSVEEELTIWIYDDVILIEDQHQQHQFMITEEREHSDGEDRMWRVEDYQGSKYEIYKDSEDHLLRFKPLPFASDAIITTLTYHYE